MTRPEEGFVAMILPFDTPTVDGRMVAAQEVDLIAELPVPVLNMDRRQIGTLTRLWVRSGWLQGFGWRERDEDGPRAVQAEIDGDMYGAPEPGVAGPPVLRVCPGWSLLTVVLGDCPAWPQAQIT